jgi:hypothetical protein
MLKDHKLFLAGMIGGVAVAIALASLFSSMAASAQMMTPMQNQTNMAMQHKQNHLPKDSDTGIFSVMGMSTAKNVTITGVSVTGNNEVTVNVRYTGNGTSTPGIGVFVMTNSMEMMHHMMMGHAEVMYGQNYGMGAGYNMMGQQWNNSTMMQREWASQSGSNFVKGGWTASGDTVKIKLDGTGISVYDAHNICVMVSPYMG